jgi:methyltransferase (TIGR00027 family)
MVAAARALGAREEDPGVRNPDYLAERLLGPDEWQLLENHPLSKALNDAPSGAKDFQAIGLSALMIVRTRYTDEKLLRAVDAGARQVVILGAGFDTRAYRFADRLRDAQVFEIDSPATQTRKRQRVEAVFGSAPSNVRYVATDFRNADLRVTLREAGLQSHEKTIVIWEGVSMYLPERAVRATFGAISGLCGPESSLVMDYATTAAVEAMKSIPSPFLPWREPWIFGLPEGREREFFSETGLKPVDFLPLFGPRAYARYLQRRDGSFYGLPPNFDPARIPEARLKEARWSSPHYSLVELVMAR